MTTRENISNWFSRGVEKGATHMIVVCDTYDYEDYPVYVSPDKDVHDVYESYNGKNMQKVMEVYNLKMDMGKQINSCRSNNF